QLVSRRRSLEQGAPNKRQPWLQSISSVERSLYGALQPGGFLLKFNQRGAIARRHAFLTRHGNIKVLWRGQRRHNTVNSFCNGDFVSARHHQRPTRPIIKRILVIRVWWWRQRSRWVTQIPRHALHPGRDRSSQTPDYAPA